MKDNAVTVFLKRVSSLFQTRQGSFKRHNADYIRPGTLEKERKGAQDNEQKNLFNAPEYRIQDLLDSHPGVRTLAVDIGSGAGWFSSKLSRQFDRVVSIEPSEAAITIAKTLYPPSDFPNIEWREGFAEQVLERIAMPEPTFFLTGVVLSHLRDEEVAKICAIINTKAPVGSILCFDECWGEEWHQQMWHVRTKAWWQAQLPDWGLSFHGPEIAETPGRFKGIHGAKIR